MKEGVAEKEAFARRERKGEPLNEKIRGQEKSILSDCQCCDREERHQNRNPLPGHDNRTKKTKENKDKKEGNKRKACRDKGQEDQKRRRS